jgi:hypothetical protein
VEGKKGLLKTHRGASMGFLLVSNGNINKGLEKPN